LDLHLAVLLRKPVMLWLVLWLVLVLQKPVVPRLVLSLWSAQ
jgi:hypothetical protein